MTERGVVIESKGKFAQVRIERNSACGKCGKCGMTENQKHVDFYVENELNAKCGDTVELEIPEANTAGLAFIGYILPLIPALILLAVSLIFDWWVWLTVLLFFAGLALGFVLVALIDKKRKHKWAESPKMINIINLEIKKENEENE